MNVKGRVQSVTQVVRVKTAAKVREVAEHPRTASLLNLLLGPAKQFAGFLLAFLVVVLILYGWAKAQSVGEERPKLRLWGELAFVGVVVWWGIATASQVITRCTREVIPAVTVLQSLIWAAVIVLAIPVATHHRYEGAVVLGGVFVMCVVGFVIARKYTSFPRIPVTVSAAMASLALLPVALAQPITVIEDRTLESTRPVAGAADLAKALRPMLFLDSAERYEPVDIGDADIQGCREKLRKEPCGPLSTTNELGDWDYLTIKGTRLPLDELPGGPDSAIYYHAVEDGSRLYLDYWWYFAHNPSPQGGDVLCADVFGWTSDACQEHPSDWEGITIALEERDCDPSIDTFTCVTKGDKRYAIVKAHYAQHDKVIVYPWETLQIEWRGNDMERFSRDAGARPLVFSALAGHASYAMPCFSKGCRQIVRRNLRERRDGGKKWENNGDAVCGTDCLHPLPTDDTGKPTEWNAFPGRWGAQHCILFGSYCDMQPAPRAPAFQTRYDTACPASHCIEGPKL